MSAEVVRFSYAPAVVSSMPEYASIHVRPPPLDARPTQKRWAKAHEAKARAALRGSR